MNRLVRTELLKQRSTRTFLAGLFAIPVIATLLTIAIFSLAGRQGNDPLDAGSLAQIVAAPAGVVTLIAVLLGVLGMAGEYRHQTITTTLLATPRRREVVAAKVLAHLVSGAAMGVLAVVTAGAIAIAWLPGRGVDVHLDADVARAAIGVVASTALFGALGVGIGAVLRNQTTAAAGTLVWLLAAEGIVGDLLHHPPFVSWLPAAAGRALVDVGSSGDGLSMPLAGVAFAGYVAALAAVGAHLTARRDVT